MNDTLSEWEKFKLLIWKNWRSHWNHRNHFIMAILTPTIFTSVLILMRFYVPVLSFETTRYKSIDLEFSFNNRTLPKLKSKIDFLQNNNRNFEYSQFLPKMALAYAPQTEIFVEELMEEVGEKLMMDLEGYTTELLLWNAMIEENYFAGVSFVENSDLFNRPMGSKDSVDFTFSLIFPSELRFYDDTFIGADWATDSNYDKFAGHEHRFPFDNNGGYVGYVREGFLYLQNVISMAFVKIFSTKTFPKIHVQRFPYRAHKQDQLAERMEVYLAFVVLTGYLYPCMYMTWVLAKERENTMKEVLKIYAVNYLTQFCAWFFFGLIIFFFANILLATVLMIRWSNGYGITTHCSWLALQIFLTTYSMASISFCFMINSFCKQAHSAIVLLGLLWLATFLPFIVIVNQYFEDTFMEDILWLIMQFLSNTAMGSAFLKILEYEKYSINFTLKNFFSSYNEDDKITVGITTLIFLGQCILYVVIGIYVDKINPGSYGIARNWNFLFSQPDTKRQNDKKRSTPIRQTKVFELESEHKKLNIQVKRLCKAYKKDLVINDVHMNFFENEIVVLMGHNGCGKTTLLMMIIGLLKPTSGAISICGFNADKSRELAHSFLGICLQQNMVLPDLSAADQLRFYCRLKGMKDRTAIESEVMYYLKAIKLVEYYHVFTRHLSAKNTRLLNICCALCSNSKVVVLDMASVGLDLDTRKLLWRLLLKEKQNRTIVLTTHCPTEAEALADRIGMMSGGELKCMGTTHFLKNMYGFGYRLICTKSEHCDVQKVTQLLRHILPDIKPESNIGIELSYRLQNENPQLFAEVLTLLEKNAEMLYLHGFYITNTTIEDIYLFTMGSSDPSDVEMERHSDLMNGISPFLNNYDDLDFLRPYNPYTGYRLWCNHCKALLHKRFSYIFRSPLFWFEMMLLPAMIMALAVFVTQYSFAEPYLPERAYTFSQYSDTVTPVKTEVSEHKLVASLAKKYLRTVAWMGPDHKTVTVKDQTMDEFMLQMQADKVKNAYKKHLIGATFSDKKLIAWFNNFALHSAAISLNVLHNALLHTHDEHSKVTVKFAPLPYANDYHSSDMRGSSSTAIFLASSLSYCFVFVYSFTIIFIVKERQNRFRLIQHIAGLKPLTFWVTSFAYDFVIIAIFSIIILAIIWIYKLLEIVHYDLAIDFAIVIFLFGISIMPFNYLMSQFYESYVLFYFVTCIFCIYGGVALAAVMDALERHDEHIQLSAKMESLFRIHPYFSLSRAFYKVFNAQRHIHLCSTEEIKVLSTGLNNCTVRPNCCVEYKLIDWDHNGILPELFAFFIIAVVCTIIMAIKEFWHLRSVSKDPDIELERETKGPSNSGDAERDNRLPTMADLLLENRRQASIIPKYDPNQCFEAVSEKLRVNSLKENELEEKPLVLNKFTKRYEHVIAADRLYLIIDRNESVGLIGKNGDGKTAIIKALTGDEKISYGKAFVHGISVTENRYEMYKHIGYCTDTTQFLDQLTVYELMRFMCKLYGMPSNEIEQRCESLAKVLGFYEDFDKRFEIVSYGNRRRLSTAIAFLGNRTMIYLDSPFRCIDPAGIRLQWNIFNTVRKSGKSLLIASNAPRECAMACTRFVVISRGNFQWLGTVHKLKSLLPMDYLLRIKIKSYADQLQATKLEKPVHNTLQYTPYKKILLFVENEFPNAFLKEENGSVLYFQIPREETTMSAIFSKIHNGFINVYIEDFIVTNARLSVSLMNTVDHTLPSYTGRPELHRSRSTKGSH